MSRRNREIERAMDAIDWSLIALAAALAVGFGIASAAGWR